MAATQDTTANAGTADLIGRLRQALARLDNQQKVVLIFAIAATIAVLVGGTLWARQGDYRVLFSNINERDGGAVIAALEQQNIPYRFNESGGAILVPSDKVHDVRLRLAAQGLPRGGAVGFELMENQKFGISQFAEQVNYQRALEGELARTIQSIGAVQGARVHLAIPKPSVFVRDEQKPSASVLLNLYPGRGLEPAQIAGIQNLVSSSVPQMPAANVTILDQSGAMLSQLKSKLLEAGLDPTQVKYVQEVETSVIKRIEDILTPIVGAGNARVQVAADIDFSQTEQTNETHKPNTTPPDVTIRSQQTSETASVNSTTAAGVPGALSNQPPVPATAPLTQPPIAGAAPGAPGAAQQQPPGKVDAAGLQAPIGTAGQPLATRKDSTINYEVDRTIRHTKQAVGSVRRLTAAVVVNHRKEIGKDGKPATKPLTDAELKQINDLAREAMGFNKERGDSLSVANASFTAVERADGGIPLWKDPDILSLVKELIKYGAIAGILAYLILKVIKPLIVTMMTPRTGEHGHHGGMAGAAGGAAAYGAVAEETGAAGPSSFEVKLENARGIAAQDPKAVANIIKDWTGSNAG